MKFKVISFVVITAIIFSAIYGCAKVDYITIKDVQYSTSLTKLDLSDMDLRNADIEPLKYMTKLTKLYLGNNQISDISSLKGLTHLTGLSLWGNQISDINPLKDWINLWELDLLGNPIIDWSPVSHVPNVEGRP